MGGGGLADKTTKQAGMYDLAVAVVDDRCDVAAERQSSRDSDCIMYTPDYSEDSASQDHVVTQHPDSSRSDQDRPSTARRSRSRSSSRYI